VEGKGYLVSKCRKNKMDWFNKHSLHRVKIGEVVKFSVRMEALIAGKGFYT